MLVQVLQEVGLGLELPGQLLGGQVADASLAAVRVGVLLHAWIVRIKIKTVRLYLGLRLNTRPTSGNVRNGKLARLQVGTPPSWPEMQLRNVGQTLRSTSIKFKFSQERS